jgi:hypothetical protein
MLHVNVTTSVVNEEEDLYIKKRKQSFLLNSYFYLTSHQVVQ